MLALLPIIFGVMGFCFSDLLNSPRPWFDEGIYLQTAKNLAEQGKFGLQILPDQIVGLDFITIGYPLIVPLALTFKIFGTSFFAARSMMVFFIGLFIFLTAEVNRQLFGRKIALLSALAVSTFGPLYGNGKNVLGEVPGLAYLLLTVLCLIAIERGKAGWLIYALTGFFLGLTAATKPSFLLVFPAILAAGLVWRFIKKQARPSWVELSSFVLSSAVCLLVWFLTQFSNISPKMIFGHYANPYGLSDLMNKVLHNAVNMFTHLTPLHFVGLLLLVMLGFLARGLKKITTAEIFIFVFILLTLISYLRTAGWYRYFFLGHILALAMAPGMLRAAVAKFWPRSGKKSVFVAAVVALLSVNVFVLVREPYPLYGSDWRNLHAWLRQVKTTEEILFINAPDAVLAYPGNNYRQFLRITERLSLGLEALQEKQPYPIFIVMMDRPEDAEKILDKYFEIARYGHVTVWQKQ